MEASHVGLHLVTYRNTLDSVMELPQASNDALNMQLFAWLTLAIRSLFQKWRLAILRSCGVDERILLNFFGGVTKSYRENKDFGKTEDHDKCPPSDQGAGNGNGGANRFGYGHDDDSEMDQWNYESSDSEENDGNEDDEASNGDEFEGDKEEDEEEDDENDGYDTSSTDEYSDYEPLLNHAREVYSEKSFCIFKHEYKKSLALSIERTSEDHDDVFEYDIRRGNFSTHHSVIAFEDEDVVTYSAPGHGWHRTLNVGVQHFVVTCSCNYFGVTGILCCHALLVLQCLHIDKIPEHYLLKWRMKSDKINSDSELSVIKENQKLRRLSSDDNFPNKSINSSLHEKKFEEHYECDDKDDDNSDYAQVGAPLLRHAKEIYISNIADMFQKEYRNSQYFTTSCFVASIKDGRLMAECNVFRHTHLEKSKIVHAYPADGTIKCSCDKFELNGILCCHALAVLDHLCIVRIPPQYLHEKFLKNVAVQVKDIHGPQFSEQALFLCYTVVNHMILARSLYNEVVAASISKLVDDREDSCDARRKKEQKKEVHFSDDQALKNFVYKELNQLDGASEATKSKRKLQTLGLAQFPSRGMARPRLLY